jgi:uncharacterized protein (TIGR00730 family)
MGALADAVLDHGGQVTGVIPEFLVNREHMLVRVQERIVTRDMHERKRVMFERADAFVALPGGVGTLEELVEQMTWAQLGRHKKPILILNVGRFWDPAKAHRRRERDLGGGQADDADRRRAAVNAPQSLLLPQSASGVQLFDDGNILYCSRYWPS